MKLFKFLVGAALASSPISVPVAPAQPSASASTSISAELQTACDELALLGSPPPTAAGIEKLINVVTNSDDYKQLETKYPGLIAAIKDRLRPVVFKASSDASIPHRAEVAALYARNLSLADVRAAVAFWRGPGAAVRADMNRRLDYTSMIREAVNEDQIKESTVRAATRAAVLPAIQQMSPATLRQAAAFGASSAGRRLAALTSQKIAIDTKWANYAPPELAEEITRQTSDALVTHVAKTDQAAADRMREALTAHKYRLNRAE